jgi:hypothetical protein
MSRRAISCKASRCPRWPIGGALVGFVLDGGWRCQMARLKHYELSVRSLVGGRGRAAGLSERGVAIFDAESESLRHVELPDAKGLALGSGWSALGGDGRCALSREWQHLRAGLPCRVSAADRGAVVGVSGVWVLLSDSLAQIRDGQLLVRLCQDVESGRRLFTDAAFADRFPERRRLAA